MPAKHTCPGMRKRLVLLHSDAVRASEVEGSAGQVAALAGGGSDGRGEKGGGD